MRRLSVRETPTFAEVMKFWDWLIELRDHRAIFWRNFIFLGLLIFYGRRINEIIPLRTSDIDLDKGLIYFKQLKTRHKDEEKALYFVSKIEPYLREYVQFCKNIGQEYLFESTHPRPRGKPITARAGLDVVYKYTKSFFGYKLFSHVFRSVLATHILQEGKDAELNLVLAKDWLGHASISSTERYIKLSDKQRKASMPEGLK